MAQNYTINSFQGNHEGQSDLQNMENNFECLRSMFSGASSPADAFAGMPWYDTGSSARNDGDNQNLLKIYNQTRSAWYGVMTGDINQKMLVYRNDQMDGWVIDEGVSDKVLAVKGGNVYTTAGTTAGSWASSSHILTTAQMPSHRHPYTKYHGGYGVIALGDYASGLYGNTKTWYTDYTGGGEGHIHAADANVRPAAAVCTIQYLDI